MSITTICQHLCCLSCPNYKQFTHTKKNGHPSPYSKFGNDGSGTSSLAALKAHHGAVSLQNELIEIMNRFPIRTTVDVFLHQFFSPGLGRVIPVQRLMAKTHIDGSETSTAGVEGLVVEIHKLLANLFVRDGCHGVGLGGDGLDAKR